MPRLHALTWLVWVLAGATCVHLASNPVYVTVVLTVAAVVVQAHRRPGELSSAFAVLVAVGAVFGIVKIVLTVLTTHGIGDPLLVLPEATLPRLLGEFTFGGAIEDIVLWRAVGEAFAVLGVLGVFGAFNAVVAHDELVRSLPRALHEPGVVLTVGLTFVPATIGAVRRVQESDRARTGGEVVRRGRLVRLTVPVLEQGMERAVLLSESMDARGFGRGTPRSSDLYAAGLALAGVVAIGGALVALVGTASTVALAATVVGAALLAAAVLLASWSTAHARYRPRHLTALDAAVMGTSVLAAAAVFALAVGNGSTLRWPGDVLTVPGVDPWVVASLLLLVVPALVPRPDERTTSEAP